MPTPIPRPVPLPEHPGALLVLPPDRGSLRADLTAWAEEWATPPAAHDLAALRHPPTDPREDLRLLVAAAVEQALELLLRRARERGEPVPERPAPAVVRTVRGLVVLRLLHRPLDAGVVPDLVDRVLLPLVTRGAGTG